MEQKARMSRRLVFFILAAFWVTMMALLWRSEFGAHRSLGSLVPVRHVWEKILTAPDASALQISHRGTNIGFCRWSASVGQDASAALNLNEEAMPDGLIETPANYKLDLEGNISLAELGARLGFDLNLTLDALQDWQEFHARVRQRPDLYEVDGIAADKALRLRASTAGGRYDRTWKFSELQNPQTLLREIGGPLLPGLLVAMGLPVSTNALPRASLGLTWEARQDWLQAGRTRLRIYRLQTKLLDRFRIRVCVSPVGEILRVELPGDVLLQHETLNSFPPAS